MDEAVKEEEVPCKEEPVSAVEVLEVDDKSNVQHSDAGCMEDNSEELDVPSIVDSISQSYINSFQPVHKRYYEAYYCTKLSTVSQNFDTCIRVHTNRVSVVYLSDKHSIFQKNQKIVGLNFKINKKINRLENTCSGKGKKGAQCLVPDAILCYIHTEDGVSYPVPAGIYGKLLEINSEIIDDPNLMIRDNVSDGFIAIILQERNKFEENIKLLQTHDQYFALK